MATNHYPSVAVTITSSFSLYDMIAMIVPGSAIELAWLCKRTDWKLDESDCSSTILWIAFLVVAYLIGIINELISNILIRPIRNNRYLLGDMESDKWYTRSLSSKIWCFVKFAIMQLHDCGKSILKGVRKTSIYPEPVDRYYRDYYFAQTYRIGNHILIMEAQLAFMRNMVLPLIIWCIIRPNGCFWPILILALTLIIFAIPMRMIKIHRCIFEDYKYLYDLHKTD